MCSGLRQRMGLIRLMGPIGLGHHPLVPQSLSRRSPAAAGKGGSHPFCEPGRFFHPETPMRLVAQLNRQRISVEFLLVPVRVNQRYGAGGVEFPDLIGRQLPTDRTEIVAQLLFVTRADDDRCDGGPLK
jgi:hypothetical protein